MNIINISDLPKTLRQAYEDGCYHSSLDINQHGIWKIYGPADIHGNRSFISFVEGTFINALSYAVTIKQFQEFGEEFGHLEEYEMPDIFKANDSHYDCIVDLEEYRNLVKLKKEKEELEKRLSEINKELNT